MKRTDTLKEFLQRHGACKDGYEFAKDLTLEQFHATCQRGDWMLLVFSMLHPQKIKEARLAAAHCLNITKPPIRRELYENAINWIIDNNGECPPNDVMLEVTGVVDSTLNALEAGAVAAWGYSQNTFLALDALKENQQTHCAPDHFPDFFQSVCCIIRTIGGFGESFERRAEEQTADICRKYLPLEMWEA
jgi:hypothetical protein